MGKRSAWIGAIIGAVVGFFGISLMAGSDNRAYLTAFLGALIGLLVAYIVLDSVFSEAQARRDRKAAVDWIETDPFTFAQNVAAVFADQLGDRAVTGDLLAETERSAALLGDSLNEIARRARANRYSELLLSRTFEP